MTDSMSEGDTEFGASVDTLREERRATDDLEESDFDEALPNGENLIAAAVALAVSTPDAPDAAEGIADAQLVQRYWRFAPDEELVDLTPERILQAARAHRGLAANRRPGELKLRLSLTAEPHHTVIELVTDDMPFLVDSVTGALTARNLDVQLLVHPVMVVRRADDGSLAEVCADVEPDDAIPDDLVESWMRVETDPLRDPEEQELLKEDLHRVLEDVRRAVRDWPAMRGRALSLADEIGSSELPVPDRDITDSVELLRWLADDHFTFLGYREYELAHHDGEELIQAMPGTGLGILCTEQETPRVLSSMTPEAHRKALEKRLLIITKANSRSTVHRNAYLDYIGFKTFDANGQVVGEKRFLGLFSSAAYRTSVRDLPVVRRKVASVMERSGLSPRSHSGKDLLEILETYPRDELFQITTDDLYQAATGVLRMAGRRQLRLFLRRDAYGRFISALVYLPRDRFTTAHRLAMQEILLRELNGIGVDYTTRVSESQLARVHFIVRTDPANPPGDVDVDGLAELLGDATRNWDDDFRLVLERKLGDEQAKKLAARYTDALPETYKDGHLPYEAVQDLAKLELLEEPGQLEMHLFRKKTDRESVRFKVFRFGEPMVLSAVLPVLHSLGVRVTDERPYEIHRGDATIYLYDFGLQLPSGARELSEVRAHVENAFAAAWRGEAEVDGFNELVFRAGLTWRQAVVLRSYAKYLRQTGTVFSQESMETTFIGYPQLAGLMVALFETRFDPRLQLTEPERTVHAKELVSAIARQLDTVDSLDQDRILRNYLTLIQATLRTSFFQRSADGRRPKSYVAYKLEPTAIPDLPAPRPKYEIFVYSPRFEGVHLRFGAVARGGLRWSDRRDDYRTEVLGLVKAQMVKNAVIVPVGAKGGFVLKQAPSTSDRDAYLAEGVTCYKKFISALLDVTDNLDAGKVVPPRDVVRHDGDDPYLVVAADKGTATFSDIANEISRQYGFWLGDAFASGGSAGYDHKKMGITARGAWESVKRHFRDLGSGSDKHSRDLGRDTQSQDFTVVGIGDMSGDVFGNGMLLSHHIKLVAAFDHRHIFLDPDPDPGRSYAERERLFALGRSSWDDYDQSLISGGGGVYPRTQKSIPISPQVGAALGLAGTVTAMSPAELMKAILLAPVDLLWNGGIGTYVKARQQGHAEVGDKANDSIRVNGAHLRCKVVGEGGNLGFTQAGRIEYTNAGGRIYTDFIDNSAGVDCSDHEVNIKILLGNTVEHRDELLADMTGEVASLVLMDNYQQAAALGSSRAQALSLLPVHRRLITELEKSVRLDRALEVLPSDEELVARGEAGEGLCAPEFAVLLAHVKIALKAEIVASDLPEEAWTTQTLVEYFPTPLRHLTQLMSAHPLRREIVTTVLVNEVVNRGGITFVHRAVEETGASVADVLRAYAVVRDVFDLPALWAAVEAADNKIPTEAQTAVYLKARRLLDRAARWLLQNRRSPMDVSGEIARLRPGLVAMLPKLKTLFLGAEREAMEADTAELLALGTPADLAEHGTRILYSFGLLDVVEVALNTGRDADEVAGVYFVLSEQFKVDALLTKISQLPRHDRWQTLARMALRYDLYAALAALTVEVLAATPTQAPAVERVELWEQRNAVAIAQARKAIGEVDAYRADLAALSVLLRQIRTLVRTAAA